jgi:hypothetical protein
VAGSTARAAIALFLILKGGRGKLYTAQGISGVKRMAEVKSRLLETSYSLPF